MGTHPIFESDFDCLTEKKMFRQFGRFGSRFGRQSYRFSGDEAQQMTWGQYFFSTHFWGPLANWGIPIAAMADCRKSPEIISPNMTGSLIIYSTLFARFAWMVTPRNMLLLACHLTNLTLQCVQMGRYYEFEHMGGKEKLAAERAAVKAAEPVAIEAIVEEVASEEKKSE